MLKRGGAHASFAFAIAPDRRTLRALGVARDQPLPELGRGGLTNWLDTKDELKRDARALGLPNRRFYLAPAFGLTAGQYLLGRDIGAAPILGSARIGPDSRGSAHTFFVKTSGPVVARGLPRPSSGDRRPGSGGR